ncbi:CIA30 family protein [Antarcticibacterium sp. 1MA-6-2]|uniref:CIA30 family protein n=1 Tax=Antarcticibacterium sp. 1MA-6-2 TaxID=2908210 RepID=UPI001F3762FB|nr:CIA30 family protein [Antarcticibacterium sp. 1MA-6-2]UJH92802.1 CIA30 family protein [Antarcticibacterium sp. 1MA-6-2]
MKTLFLYVLLMNSLLLYDFSASSDWSSWEIENDVVMGGKSSSELTRSPEGNAVFTGFVSLENNGGFASMQNHFASRDIKGYDRAVIRLKGDGKKYQFRIKANLEEKASYVYDFKTSGDWQTIEIPLNQMKPTYRGNKLDLPNFNADKIQEIRFFIGNGKAENFKLEIDKIELQPG